MINTSTTTISQIPVVYKAIISVPLEQSKYGIITWLKAKIKENTQNIIFSAFSTDIDYSTISADNIVVNLLGDDIVVYYQSDIVNGIISDLNNLYMVDTRFNKSDITIPSMVVPTTYTEEVLSVGYASNKLWVMIEENGLIDSFRLIYYPDATHISKAETQKLIPQVGLYIVDVLVVIDNGSNEELFYDIKFLEKLKTFVSDRLSIQ